MLISGEVLLLKDMKVETLLQELQQHRYIFGGVVFFAALAWLVSALGNIEKLHAFGVKAWAEWRKRKTPVAPVNALADELEKLKRRVKYVGFVNDIPVELHKLRDFFLAADLVSKPQFSQFFSDWLSEPIVVMGEPVLAPGLYGKEGLARLLAELEDLRL